METPPNSPPRDYPWLRPEDSNARLARDKPHASNTGAQRGRLVKKADGSMRFAVDYRRLNSISKHDSYPLPKIDSCLDALNGSCYFSTIDLRSAFWQVAMDESDAEKTSFVTRRGCYKFN